MKHIKNYYTIFIFLFFSILNLNAAKNNDLDQFCKQFASLVKYNEENVRNGCSEKNNYIFIYEPGKVFNPADLTTSDWIFEDPNQVFLSGSLSTYYHNELNTYNTRPTLESPPQVYQHYVMVYKLDAPIRSLYAEYVMQPVTTRVDLVFKDLSNNYSPPLIYTDEDWYNAQHNVLSETLRLGFKKYDIFTNAPNHHYYITFASVENSISPQFSNASSPAKTSNLKVNSKVKVIGWSWENDVEFFTTRLAAFRSFQEKYYPGTGLTLIAQRIKAFIHFFNHELVPGAPCEDILLSLTTVDARNWMQTKCSLIANYQHSEALKEFIWKSAEFIDYYTYLNQEHGSTNDLTTTIYKINDLIAAFIATGSAEYSPFLVQRWNQESDKTAFIRFYYKAFFDLDQQSIQSLKDDLKAYVDLINNNHNWWNFLIPNGNPYSTGISKYQIKRFNVELGWDELNRIFETVANGAYSTSELYSFFTYLKSINNIEVFLWNKVFNGTGGGSIIYKSISSSEISENLANFVIKATISQPDQVLDNNTNVVVWDISSKYTLPGLSSANYILDKNYFWQSNYTVGGLKVQYCTNYEADFSSCEPDDVWNCVQTVCTTNEWFTPVSNKGFFDIVYLIKVRDPLYIEGTPPIEQWQDGYPRPLFVVAQKIKDDRENELFSNFTMVLQLAATAYSGGIYATATAPLQRLVAGIFFYNAVASFYVFSPSFEPDMKALFGDNTGEDIASFITGVNVTLGAFELAGVNGIIKITVPNQYKIIAFSRMMDEAVASTGMPGIQASRLQKAAKIMKGELFFKNPSGATNAIDDIYYGLYSQNLQAAVRNSAKLRDYIRRCRFQNLFANVENTIAAWPQAKINKFVQVLDNNPAVLDYLGGITGPGQTISAIEKTNRLTAWSDLYNANKLFAIGNKNAIEGFETLNASNKAKALLLTDNASTQRLTTFLEDVNTNPTFKNLLNDNSEIAFIDGMVGHHTGYTVNQYNTIVEELKNLFTPGSGSIAFARASHWIDYSSNTAGYLNRMQKGVDFNNAVKASCESLNSSIRQQIATKLGLANLNDYQMVSEVPFNVIGGFMKTDMLFVKIIGGNIVDIIVVENKLSQATSFTIRQNTGFTYIKNATGSVDMNVTYNWDIFVAGQPLSVNKNKCLKLWGDGSGGLSGIDMDIITNIIF